MDEDEMYAAVFRDIYRAAVVYKANTTGAQQIYELVFTNGETVAMSPSWIVPSSFRRYQVQTVYAKVSASSSWAPHGSYQYPGYVTGDHRSYHWLDATASFDCTVNVTLSIPNPTANSWVLNVYRWDDGIVTLVNSAGNAAGASSLSVDLTQSGYYSFEFEFLSSAVGTLVEMYWASSASSYAHLSAGPLEANLLAVGQYRVNAASLMYTNEASPLNKQGKIAGLQYGFARQWFDFAAAGYDEVAKANRAVALPIADGMHIFMKPRAASDFDLKRGTIVNNGQAVYTGYPLDAQEEYIMLFGSVTDTNGRDGYFTICHHIEYETTDTYREVLSPHIDPEAFREASLLIVAIPQVHKNANHVLQIVSKIRDALRKGASSINLHVPKVIQLAQKDERRIAKAAD